MGSVVRGDGSKFWPYYFLFFVSGISALLYQIVWERALFTVYGVNIESVTVIVTIFMVGLGLGSLAGGRLSSRPRIPLLRAFGAVEISIGAFGAVSLALFHRVAAITAGASLSTTAIATFLLLLIPTLLMGSTLPMLVTHLVRRTENVGESVGSLYAVNTLGSGIACFAAALFLMRDLGESRSVRLAAALNFAVGISALLLARKDLPEQTPTPLRGEAADHNANKIPFALATFFAAAIGFVALAYEIVWFRLYSFASAGAAPCFAKLLAFYLFGIGYGSVVVRRICRQQLRYDLPRKLECLSKTLMLGSAAGFLVAPALAFSIRYVPYDVSFALVFTGAALLGAAFPILAHASIQQMHAAGSQISYLYLANIIGSALGSFLVGFVLLDHWSTHAVSLFLLAMGVAISIVAATMAGGRPPWRIPLMAIIASVVIVWLSEPVYSSMYERLLAKSKFTPDFKFRNLVENRSGVIAVEQNETVYGGGIYDGRFSTDLVHDSNGIFRAYAMGGLHPDPKRVLVIGLSSGSWAQIAAHHPQVQHVTIVEINPGYLALIRARSAVSSLLRNPKVEIVIDDGRRWLVANPNQKFDFILMNTTFSWRSNVSSLLSVEFGELIKSHLSRGGVAYYNTTGSGEVQATGASEFPYALRVANFLAVSESPIVFDKDRWRKVLAGYEIDGQPVLNLERAEDQARIQQLLQTLDDPVQQPRNQGAEIETRGELLARWKGYRLITDDNMGTEW